MNSSKIVQGVFGNSAEVLRDLQKHFNPSSLFAPWLAAEKAKRDRDSHNQRQRRRNKQIQVKLGHGGTLDPIATGVLTVGVGAGTKALQGFLDCTKTYEAVVLFGVATDTYDCVGKVLGRAQYSHITKDGVEEALQRFRGKILQRPPVFSALRMQGKRLYEYAREGKETPAEIRERPVEVTELKLVEWMEGGAHPFTWPEEVDQEERAAAEQVLHAERLDAEPEVLGGKYHGVAGIGTKRKRELATGTDREDDVPEIGDLKRRRPSSELNMSVAPQSSELPKPRAGMELADMAENTPSLSGRTGPPAARIRMTVTSGFYVRSLCHDLGQAVGSMGIMSELIRTRQGQFSLKENVLEYDDLAKGEDEWGPKVDEMLSNWTKESG
ncbi:MAG: hypothetical protein M1839_001644 [Geoglossum umbratile]|nr:MAG: hypothetical protein M1839_001644 [Geoglossum umbratile]